MRWTFIVSLLLAFFVPVRAADVAIYSGSAEVGSQSDADRESGLRGAFRSALIKASGDASLARDPALVAILGRASGLARHYAYRESTQTGSDGAMELRMHIEAEFDPAGVESALRDLGRPLWGRERPTLLVWLVIDNNGNKQIANAFQQSALGALLTTAEQRGLPLQLPRMDGADLNRVNPVTLWDAPPATIIGASQRYNARVILVARLQKLSSGWTARYTLIEGHQFESWEFNDALASGALSQAINGSVDRIARRYATDHSGPPLGAVQVWIEDLRSAADFASAIGYLERMSAVSEVAGDAAESGRLRVSLQVSVSAQRLRQLLAMDKVLTLEQAIAAPNTSVPASPFALRLVH